MRKLLISAAAIALFSLPALAQPDRDHGPGHGGGGAPPAPHGGGPAPQAPHGGGAPHPQSGSGFNRGPNGGNSGRAAMTTNAPANNAAPALSRGPNGGAASQPARRTNPAYTRGPNGGGPNMAARPGQGSNHGGAGGNGGARHDFHGFVDFHQNVTAQRHFHAGAYQRPQGWYSHHWVFGETLPAFFWARNYWLMDYVDFGLPPPPYGAVWVRYGDDALLIDQGSGEIITVEYGVFY